MDELWEELLSVFKTKEDAEWWLHNNRLSQFGGVTPWEMCLQGGTEEVILILRKFRHGVW
jgi:hypothetical protein